MFRVQFPQLEFLESPANLHPKFLKISGPNHSLSLHHNTYRLNLGPLTGSRDPPGKAPHQVKPGTSATAALDKIDIAAWSHTAMVGGTVCNIESLDPIEVGKLGMGMVG